ncbi:deoxyribodipyrimidine photo-lyase [Vulcanimicrobium alpinum]|uniref:Deoxyribodipyrimidine photo-lyase n=1 Tax=Vulcanimicrobium alpinum TaxID=3016050 RepID=A0AAN1XZD3_UNVUL|nr:deoxyribodipyrimidine photo-lyase [Vulcanimicrobium alpinum]BDE08178.1 deoxyribodipyrimidine photo-lyase [Vulcanimicrobium alpinum]
MAQRYPLSLVWLRRDLRLDDNVALRRAAEASEWIACAFVLDPPLLRGPRVGPPIVQFFFDSLGVLRERLRQQGSDLALLEGDFSGELVRLARRIDARAVFYNVDYDPDAVARDEGVERALRAAGLDVHAQTDHVYFGARDVLQESGKPYTVYTPYRRRWNARFDAEPHPPVASERAAGPKLLARDAIGATCEVPRPEDYGHASSERYPRGGSAQAKSLLRAFLTDEIDTYAERRNAPALDGTSHLSPHLRAGTIGIRTLVHTAAKRAAAARGASRTGIDTWTGELVWRDFYQQLLVHFPRVAHQPFVEAATAIAYERDERRWNAWRDGTTGYPIVDAAMIQLNTTGWMHNRLRMIVASFYTKHLLGDYRDGERYFERHLADADLAANNGGWQWSSSTGTDAAPYFRVFNPTLQGEKFDPDGAFVRAMIPALVKVPSMYVHQPWTLPPLLQAEYGCVIGRDYPAPIVDHAEARKRAIDVYGAALGRRVRT